MARLFFLILFSKSVNNIILPSRKNFISI
jgi:hypothetical protein